VSKRKSQWTTETSQAFLQKQLDDMRATLDERYATQTKALDAAFVAAQASNQTALNSAERAVAKAEIAADKRFDSVNEFRAALSDQTNTFITRKEAEAQTNRNAEDIQKLSARVEHSEGRGSGITAGWTYLVGFASLVATIITIYILVHG